MKYSNGNAHKQYDRPQRLNPTPTGRGGKGKQTRREKRVAKMVRQQAVAEDG